MKLRFGKKKRHEIISFITGCLVIGVIWLAVSISTLLFKTPTQSKTANNVVAPYYDPKVFKLPKGILTSKEASVSAKIPIIMFHYVEFVQDVNDLIRRQLDINPYLFEGQLKALHDVNFDTYFVRDVPDILNGNIDYNASRSAVLTFDDGYEDFYRDAFPILKKYQMKATIYIIYDYIGRRGFLSVNEIRELINSGLVEVGSHTFDHIYLSKIASDEARRQIVDSKKAFEERFGIDIKTLAYPYGAFDQQAIDLTKEASYSAAVSVIPGSIQSNNNLFYLYRIRAGNFTPQTIVRFLENYNK